MVRTQSIDFAAWGFLRHRFVRALGASLYTGGAVLLFCLLVGPETELDLGFVLGNLVLLAAVCAAFALAGALVDWLHRRVVALVWLPLATFASVCFLALVIGLAGLAALAVISAATGEPSAWVEEQLGQFREQGYATTLATLVAFAIVGLFALEVAGWSIWQLVSGRGSFLASRGWRWFGLNPLVIVGRKLTMPGFVAAFGRSRAALWGEYLVVSIFNSGWIGFLIIAWTAALYLEQASSGSPDAADSLFTLNRISVAALAMIALFVSNLLGAGAWVARLADRRATRLYQDVRQWDGRPPVVFLRAFDQDKHKLRAHTADPVMRLAAGVAEPRTMDEILLESASPYGPVIAVGDPRDPTPPLGAARIFVSGDDHSWQGVVTSLVGASKAVILSPAHGEGVRWEIDLIARLGAGGRTIYLANPELSAEETAALFQPLYPDEPLTLRRGQRPVAAFRDPRGGWRVVTAGRLSVQTVTIGLNLALQALLGLEGVPLRRPRTSRVAEAGVTATAAAG